MSSQRRDGFYPMILAKKIGTLHKPNKFYLEYVPEHILKKAIKHVTLTRYKAPLFSEIVASRKPLSAVHQGQHHRSCSTCIPDPR